MYVLSHPTSLPPALSFALSSLPPPSSYPLSPMFELPGYSYPSPSTPFDVASLCTQSLSAPAAASSSSSSSYDFLSTPTTRTRDHSASSAASMSPYSLYTHHHSPAPASFSTQSKHTATVPSSPLLTSLVQQLAPPTELISTLPSPSSNSNNSSPTIPSSSSNRSSSIKKHLVNTHAPVSTVAPLNIPLPSSTQPTTPLYSAHHDRRSSAAVGTHTIDNQRATTAANYTAAAATAASTSSGPTAVAMSHSYVQVQVKTEKGLCGEVADLPGLRVDVDMANATTLHNRTSPHSSASALSSTRSHSPTSLPSFTASSSSTLSDSPMSHSSPLPASPIPSELDAMDNAIDFQFATAYTPLRTIRHRKRRRKVDEINVCEIWRCGNAECSKIYKRTSSVSINRHKEECEYRVIGSEATDPLSQQQQQESGSSVSGSGSSADVMQLIQQLLSGESESGGGGSSTKVANPLTKLLSMATDGVSLEQLLTGALSEHLIRHLTAQQTSTTSPTTTTPAATLAALSSTTTPLAVKTPAAAAAGRKRSYRTPSINSASASTGDLPSLTRSSTTPATLATTQLSAPPHTPQKRIKVLVPRDDDVRVATTADSIPAPMMMHMEHPSTPSPTNALSVHLLSLHSPHSTPAASHHHYQMLHYQQQQQQYTLPHSVHHARAYSALMGRQHYNHHNTPQPVRGSFLNSGGLLTGLVGNELVKARVAGVGEGKLDATAALSLKAAQVAMAQRELVANLFGHEQLLAALPIH